MKLSSLSLIAALLLLPIAGYGADHPTGLEPGDILRGGSRSVNVSGVQWVVIWTDVFHHDYKPAVGRSCIDDPNLGQIFSGVWDNTRQMVWIRPDTCDIRVGNLEFEADRYFYDFEVDCSTNDNERPDEADHGFDVVPTAGPVLEGGADGPDGYSRGRSLAGLYRYHSEDDTWRPRQDIDICAIAQCLDGEPDKEFEEDLNASGEFTEWMNRGVDDCGGWGSGPNGGLLPTDPGCNDLTCPTDATEKPSKDGANPVDTGGIVETESFVHTLTATHHHHVYDYKVPKASGCIPCGAISDLPNGLPTLMLERRHRYQDFDIRGSFGPGVFHQWDMRLHLYAGGVIEFWSPQENFAHMFEFQPGLNYYIDPERSSFKSLTLFSDSGLTNVVTSHAAANFALLESHSGRRWVFEIVNPIAAEPDLHWGRLIQEQDRSGNFVVASYEVGDAASLQDHDPQRFWLISALTDAYGFQLTITNDYQEGGYVTTAIQQPNGYQIDYKYKSRPLIGLDRVEYPDGTKSQFDLYDAADAPYLYEIKFDDAAAQPGETRSSVVVDRLNVWTKGVRDGLGDLVYWSEYFVHVDVQNPAYRNPLPDPLPPGFIEEDVLRYWGDDGDRYIFSAGPGNTLHRLMTTSDGLPLRRHRAVNWSGDLSRDGFTEPGLKWEQVATYVTDANRRVVEKVGATGVTLTYDRSLVTGAENGRVVSDNTDPLGTTLAQHNAYKFSTLSVDRFGRAVTHEYDPARPWLRTKTTRGLQYDATLNSGLGGTVTTADVGEWEFGYRLSDGQLDWAEDANDNRTDYDYYPNGLLWKVTEPADENGGTRPFTEYTYTANSGLLETTTDPMGRVTTYAYDERNRLITTTYQDGSYEELVYGEGADDGIGLDNDANLVVRERDRNGNWSECQYDDAGRKVFCAIYAHKDETLPELDRIETWTYIPGSDKVDIHTLDGVITDYDYDQRLRVVRITVTPRSGTNLVSETVYDAFNRIAYTIDPYGRRTYSLYDIENRLLRTVAESVPGAVPLTAGANPADRYGGYQLFEADLLALTRLTTDNPSYVITDTTYLPVPATPETTDTSFEVYQVADARGIISTREYDWQGRLSAMVQADEILAVGDNDFSNALNIFDLKVQARTEYGYDAQGNQMYIRRPRYFDTTDVEGFQQAEDSYTYTNRNLVKTHTLAPDDDGVQHVESFAYYLDGREHTRTDFRGNVWTKLWHACCGRLQAIIDPSGNGRIVNTDFAGNITHEVVAANVPTTLGGYTWHDPTDVDTVNEVTTRYDQRYRPTHRTVWLGAQGLIDDDGWNGTDFNNIPIAGEGEYAANLGLTTRWSYDDDLWDATAGAISLDLAFTLPYTPLLSDLGISATSDFSAVAMQNPEGEMTLTIADAAGRVVRRFNAEGHATTVTHDQLSNGSEALSGSAVSGGGTIEAGLLIAEVTDAVNSVTRAYSDGLGRTRYARDAEGYHSASWFDNNGNRLAVRDANGVGQDCVFDERNRDTQCTDTMLDVTSRTYDSHSNVITSTDGMSNTQLCAYDARDRRVECTDRLNGLTAFAYDANNNLLSITDAEGGETVYRYDERNLNDQISYPGHIDTNGWGGTGWDRVELSYDAARRLNQRRDQIGDQVFFDFDFANRLTDRRYPDGLDDAFTYDDASRMLSADSQRYNVSVVRSYYDDGALEDEQLTAHGQTYTVGYFYDAANRLTDLTYPNLTVLDLTYTARHQLETLTWDGAATPVVDLDYDAGGREEFREFATGQRNRRTYRMDNLVSDIETVAGSPAVIDFHYEYDANKRKTSESDALQTDWDQIFGYDDENRLTDWDRSGDTGGVPQNLDWDLSLVGDWDKLTIDLTTEQNRGHDAVHQIADIDGQALAHDQKGNVTADPLSGNGYQWDYDNRLEQATNGGGDTITFGYDALGRRVWKTVDDGTPETTVFVCAGPRVLSEYGSGVSSGSPTRSYVWAQYVDDLVAIVNHGASDTLNYVHSNHLFSVAAITNEAGTVIERYGYDAYGERVVTLNDPTFEQPYGFTGRRLDDDTGLWYFRARYFDRELGRFIGRDPLGYVDGMSLYSGYFVPNGLDPSGEITYKISEKSCKVTMEVSVQLIFEDYGGTSWTQDRKEAFFEAYEQSVESTFSNNDFKISTDKGKGVSEGWVEIAGVMMPTRDECECPCPNGFSPVLDLKMVPIGQSSVTEDLEATVRSNPSGGFLQSSQNELLGYARLDEADVTLVIKELGSPPQNPAAHEFGHFLGIHHPGEGLGGFFGGPLSPGADEYTHVGRDRHGRIVDGTVDLMGAGNGLRGFYFDKWRSAVNQKYPGCDYGTK